MACNFVFVQHPYDVGDWVDSKEGEWVVDSIHLTHSTYHTIDDKITGQISHVEAAKLTIKNKSRSPKVKEVIASEFRSNLPLIMDDNIRVYLEDSIRGILKSHPLSRFLDTKTFELAINLPEVVVVIYHKPTWMMETQRADCGAAFKKLFDIAIRNYVPPGPIKEQKSPSQAQYSPKTGPIEPRRHRSSDRAYKNESHSPRASSEPTNTDPVRHHHGSTHHSSHRPCSANASPVFRNIWENPSTVIRERPESNSPPRSSHPSPFSPSRPW